MKKSIYIVLLVISIIILLSGLTMSYFYDKSDKIAIPFTTGTFKVELKEIFPNEEILKSWKPGDSNAIPLEWSFKNVGSQRAKLRVKLEGKWDDETLDKDAVHIVLTDTDWNKKDPCYYEYHETIKENDEVSIGFDVLLDLNPDNITPDNCEAYNGAGYKITLTMEAIQVNGSWE